MAEQRGDELGVGLVVHLADLVHDGAYLLRRHHVLHVVVVCGDFRQTGHMTFGQTFGPDDGVEPDAVGGTDESRLGAVGHRHHVDDYGGHAHVHHVLILQFAVFAPFGHAVFHGDEGHRQLLLFRELGGLHRALHLELHVGRHAGKRHVVGHQDDGHVALVVAAAEVHAVGVVTGENVHTYCILFHRLYSMSLRSLGSMSLERSTRPLMPLMLPLEVNCHMMKPSSSFVLGISFW